MPRSLNTPVCEALEASRQLQKDKETYGADYIHLYVEDIEGDWLENWEWEDSIEDYVDAFYHHCEQGNYLVALEIIRAGAELFNKPEHQAKGFELYAHLESLTK